MDGMSEYRQPQTHHYCVDNPAAQLNSTVTYVKVMEAELLSLHGTANLVTVLRGPLGTQATTQLLTTAISATPFIQEFLAIEDIRELPEEESITSILPAIQFSGKNGYMQNAREIMDKPPFCSLCYAPKTDHPTMKFPWITDQDKLITVRHANYLNMLKNRGSGSSNGRPPVQKKYVSPVAHWISRKLDVTRKTKLPFVTFVLTIGCYTPSRKLGTRQGNGQHQSFYDNQRNK